jgi:hypothetical protein
MDYKLVIGIIAAIIGLISYIPYLRDCAKKKTRPSVYTWMIWTIMTLIAFIAQLKYGAGPGSFVLGIQALINVAVLVFAFRNNLRKRKINWVDKTCFSLAVLAIILWSLTGQGIYAIVLVTLADALAFTITIKKTYFFPYEETLITYVFAGIKHFLAIVAMGSYSLTTTLFPAYLVIFNIIFVTLALIRRKKIRRK